MKFYSVKDLFTKTAEETFVTEAEDTFIYPKPAHVDGLLPETNSKIYWTLYQDLREFGIKDIRPSVTKIEITGVWEIAVDIDEDPKEEPFKLTITRDDWEIEEDYEDVKFSHGLYPVSVNVDLKNKTVTVDF
jgi:hypothetical protein